MQRNVLLVLISVIIIWAFDLFLSYGGATLKQVQMVVVEGGFRDRWHRQVLSRQHGTAGNQCEDSQQDLFGLQRDEFSDVADDSFLHVHGFAGSDAEGSLDLPLDPEQNLEQGSTLSEGSQKRFLEPRPKSRPQSLVSGVTRSLGVKRTADEFASMKVHGHFSELKQPWQRGPLSPLFGKNLQLLVCFQSWACLTMSLQATQQQRFRALSSNWKQQSSASGRPGSSQVMMIFAGCLYPGSRPWFCWRSMQQNLDYHY